MPMKPWPRWRTNSAKSSRSIRSLGMRLSLDQQARFDRELLERVASAAGDTLVQAILTADQTVETGIRAQRERVAELKRILKPLADSPATNGESQPGAAG